MKEWHEEVANEVMRILKDIGDEDLMMEVYESIDKIYEWDEETIGPHEEKLKKMHENDHDPEKMAYFILSLIKNIKDEEDKTN